MRYLQQCLSLLAFVLGVVRTSAIDAQDLGGSDWQLSNSNNSIHTSADVPGYVREALQRAGLIQNPLFGQNEEQQHWISLDTWTFTRQFQVSSTQLQAAAVDLLLDGLDTLADVRCNGQLVLEARNFHRQYQVPVKHVLQEGNNNISITLNSSVRAAYQAADAYPYEVPSNPIPRGYLFYNFVRKPASDFGWDWGPAVAPVGIYGNITLLSYDVPYITGVHVQQAVTPEEFNADVEVPVRAPANMTHNLTLTATLAGVTTKQEVTQWFAGLQRIYLQVAVPREAVRLWWPRGLGPQPLYPLTVSLAESNATCAAASGVGNNTFTIRGTVIDANTGCSLRNLQLGFRQVELVTEPLVQAWSNIHPNVTPLNLTTPSTGPLPPPNSTRDAGESFYFRVNGKPVYIQGANLIPLDVLHTRAGPPSVQALLRQAARAGMNMIRVWGGGRYQIDELYEWCDQHGIMVWQELMYACAPYPRDLALMDEGALEAEEQLRRLAYHPSIAIWGGNNEVEALFDEYAVVQQNFGLYASDFDAWFTDKLRAVVEQLDPARPYLDTSPTDGLYSRNPYIKRWGNTQNPRFGDAHFYNYIGDCMKPSHYPPAKFVSEHGFQSMPSWQAISPVTQPSGWEPFSSAMEYRQRHPWGQQELLNQLAMHFNLPQEWQQRTAAAQRTVADLAVVEASGPVLHAPLRDKPSTYIPLPLGTGMQYQQVIQTKVPPNAIGSTMKRRAKLMEPSSGSNTSATQVGLLQTWIYLTQVQQALCLSTAAQQWRRLSLDPSSLTMGLLYWQLNDIWAGYSWSGLDVPDAPGVSPHWKPLHYAMARAFGPISAIANANDGDGQVKVMLVSNVGLPITANVTLRLVPLSAELDQCGTYWQQSIMSVTVPPQGMQPLWNSSTAALLSHLPGCTTHTCYLAISVAYTPQGQCYGQAEGNSSTSNKTGDSNGPAEGGSAGSVDALHCDTDWWLSLTGDIAGVSLPLPANTTADQSQPHLGSTGAQLLFQTQLFFEYPKDLQLSVPCNASQVVMEDWVVESDQRVCFTLSTPCVLPYLVLGFDTPATLSLPGFFSDNMFALDPCQAKRVCFTYDGGKGETLNGTGLLQAVRAYTAPWDLQSVPV